MPSDIIREFDPNIFLPEELKDAVMAEPVSDSEIIDQNAVIDIQFETLDDIDSSLDEESVNDDIEAPDEITIISQTTRTAPDGRQVVDVVIDVSDVEGAMNYDVRITKA